MGGFRTAPVVTTHHATAYPEAGRVPARDAAEINPLVLTHQIFSHFFRLGGESIPVWSSINRGCTAVRAVHVLLIVIGTGWNAETVGPEQFLQLRVKLLLLIFR